MPRLMESPIVSIASRTHSVAGVHVAHAKRHITVPEDVLRMSVGGRVVFISHCATSVRREAREYRAE